MRRRDRCGRVVAWSRPGRAAARRLGGIRLLGSADQARVGGPESCVGLVWRRPAGLALLRSDLEGQPRSLRIADVDALAVVDVDDRHPVAVDVGPVQRAVVDRQPSALIEAQDQVRAGDPRIRDAHVGVHVAPDDHLVACREGTLGPVVPNCQDGRGGSSHYSSIGRARRVRSIGLACDFALFRFGHS